jgi:hypothetical protein
MKKVLYFAVIALSAMMVSCCKQASEEKAEGAVAGSPQVAAVRLAMNLAQYGYEVESAAALIEAADILVSTPTTEMENPEIERGTACAEGEAKADKAEITPAQLLKDAKELAADNAAMLELAANVEKKMAAAAEGTRGNIAGAVSHVDRVDAYGSDVYYMTFRAGEKGEVGLIGDGDTDLDLYVYDENGNLIASDTDYTDDCYVSFYPRWTGRFKVKIVNRGRVYNQYLLLTN